MAHQPSPHPITIETAQHHIQALASLVELSGQGALIASLSCFVRPVAFGNLAARHDVDVLATATLKRRRFWETLLPAPHLYAVDASRSPSFARFAAEVNEYLVLYLYYLNQDVAKKRAIMTEGLSGFDPLDPSLIGSKEAFLMVDFDAINEQDLAEYLCFAGAGLCLPMRTYPPEGM